MFHLLLLFATLIYHPALISNQFEKYLSYLEQLSQDIGSAQNGEIELVLDREEILKIEQLQESRLLKKGCSPDEAKKNSRVGIVHEDQYWILLRDAVRFPSGGLGTYNRLLWKQELSSTHCGAAILPILPSGQIALILNYRHATRSWELELPRGVLESNETIEHGAIRELKEETGLEATSVTLLGTIAPDTGTLSSINQVFAAHVSDKAALPSPDEEEAIEKVLFFTQKEIEKGLLQGYLPVVIHKERKNIPLRDSYLAYALLQAKLRSLL